jgi:hypothetical protein
MELDPFRIILYMRLLRGKMFSRSQIYSVVSNVEKNN